ncbi:hypothetical protein [Actinomadura gamaensis]|uniref:YbaB/EbfC DNA-binding family protein n=1 Tax=Actinomadura gamaensis TaxID=1763541 RepID=A0ABV9UB56_9ACTN
MDERISQARRRLAELRTNSVATESRAGQIPARATISSEDDRVRVTAVEGRLSGIELDARLLRQSQAELESQLTQLINTALAKTRPQPRSAEDAPSVDLDTLRTALDTVLDQARIGMQQVTAALADASTQINQRAVMRGSIAPPDIEGLFAQTRAVLDSASRTAGEVAAEVWTMDNRIYAKATSTGQVTRIWWEPDAGTAEITDGLTQAVNTALADAANSVDQGGPRPASPIESLEAVQDASVAQLRNYVSSLQALMSNVQPK